MNVFITGATGFIGKRLVEFIEKDSRFGSIYCLCRKNHNFSPRIKVITGSLDDLDKAPTVRADVCIHLAAVTDSSAADNNDIIRINSDGTERVVKYCQRCGIPRIVFLSSSNVHLKKKYSYGLSKLYAEEHIKKSDLEYSILRCSLVYGEGCPSFEKILRFASLLHIIPVLGNGKSYKQPIYIDEVCRQLTEHSFYSGNTLQDLYGKTKITYNEMVKTLLDEADKRAALLHLPIRPFLFFSEIFYKLKLPFPVSPEQISHMCENSCSESPSESAEDLQLCEFCDNLRKYIR